jgi:CRP-like cAMP-binding protein
LTLLAGCSNTELDRIAAALRPRQLAPGEVLMREGDAGRYFALIVAGQVEVTRSAGQDVQHLALATTGSILGELALLRHRPRTATVTAITSTLVGLGDHEVLEELLESPVVATRLRRLASARLAHDLRPVPAVLRDGTPLLLRPLLPEDREAYTDGVRGLSADSRRRRFFTPAQPSPQMLEYLLDIDYVDHFAWVVLDRRNPGDGLAIGRYVRDRDDPETAEMSFGVADRLQGRGIGTVLLGAVGVAAKEAGMRRLVGHVLEDNAPMRAVLAKGGGVSTFSEPGVVRVEVDPTEAACLLDGGLRRELRAAVHDVVTAASLALTNPG